MYDRILLPTDGADEMEPVIRHAGELATVHDAAVELIYVVDTANLASLPADASIDNLSQMLRRDGERALDVAENLLPEDVTAAWSIRDGAPVPEILEHATETAVDLIVMGTHGRGGIDRLILGSVAEGVVRKADQPVLTVRIGGPGDGE
jgi:nucleotide-binding universal stress UspA family protein